MLLATKRGAVQLIVNETALAVGVHRVFGISIFNFYIGFNWRDLKAERAMTERIFAMQASKQPEKSASDDVWGKAMGGGGAASASN